MKATNQKRKNQPLTRLRFKDLVKASRVRDVSSIGKASALALGKAKRFLKKYDRYPQAPRILPIPKSGGFLPALVPLLASLSAIGSLAGGAASVAKAVNEARDATKRLEETKRHNLKMEEQKVGQGLYIKPYRKGYGLYTRGF